MNADQKQILRTLVDEAGTVDVLRVLGSIIAHDSFDPVRGDERRALLFKMAREMEAEQR